MYSSRCSGSTSEFVMVFRMGAFGKCVICITSTRPRVPNGHLISAITSRNKKVIYCHSLLLNRYFFKITLVLQGFETRSLMLTWVKMWGRVALRYNNHSREILKLFRRPFQGVFKRPHQTGVYSYFSIKQGRQNFIFTDAKILYFISKNSQTHENFAWEKTLYVYS
jgi:hypothetical protein